MGGERRGGEGARGWEEEGGFLVCWGPFGQSARWWQPDREGEEGEEEERELSHTMHHQFH